VRSPRGLEALLAEMRGAVMASRDPEGALARLRRHVRREREFSTSPASLTVDQLAVARASGVPLQLVAASTRH